MRALLDLMRENEPRLQSVANVCAHNLEYASQHLTILDPKVGEKDLIKAVAAEVARLRALSRSV